MRNKDVRKIAKAAGVSPTTVSRYFSGFQYVSKLTRSKIEAAIQDVKTDSGASQSIALGIGYIAQKGVLEFYSDIIDELVLQCQQQGISTRLIGIRLDHPDIESMLDAYAEILVLVLVGSITPEVIIRKICDTGKPVILIDNSHIKAHNVGIDNRRGVEIAMDYLYRIGHRKIAMIGASEQRYSQKNRFQGYCQAIDKYGLDEIYETYHGGDFYTEGKQMVQNLLKRGCDFTAMISTGDMMTVGAINMLKGSGIQVPEQVSVIGFGEPNVSENYTPRITTLSLMSAQVSKLTLSLFHMIIHKEITEPVSVYLTPEIIHRDSCGIPSQ